MPSFRSSLLAGFILSLGLAGSLWAKSAPPQKKGAPASAAACDPKKQASAEKKLSDATAAQKKAKSAADKKKAESALAAAKSELAKLGCKPKGSPAGVETAKGCDPKKKAAADKKLSAAKAAKGKAKSAGDKKKAESSIAAANSELAKLGCKVDAGDPQDHKEQVKVAKKHVDDDRKGRKQKADADFNAVMAKVIGVYKARRDRLTETVRSISGLNEALKSCDLKVLDTGGTPADMRLMNGADQCEPGRIRRANPKFAVAQIGSQMKVCMDAAEKGALLVFKAFSDAAKKEQGSVECKAMGGINKGIATTSNAIEKAGEAEGRAKDAIVKTVKNQASAISDRFRNEAKPLVKSLLITKIVPLIQDKGEGAIEEQVTGVIGYAVTEASQAAFGLASKLSAGAEICLYIQPLIGAACAANPAVLAACEAGCEGFAVEAMSVVQKEFEKILTDEIYARVFKPYIHGKSDQIAKNLIGAIDGW